MSTPRRTPLFWVLVALLAIEAALLAAVTLTLGFELMAARPQSYASAIALLVLAALATAWLVAIIVGTIRGQAWIRGAAVTWQVLQAAVGLGALQGYFAASVAGWGWALIALSLVTFALLFVPGVVAATSGRARRS